MVAGIFNGPTAQHTKVNFNRIRFRVMEHIVGLMAVTMLDSGSTIRCRARARLNGPMVASTKEVISMIKKKGLASSIGKTAEDTKDTGKMESSMERARICLPRV